MLIAEELLVYDDNLSAKAEEPRSDENIDTEDNEYFNLLIGHNIK
jgi:hypothetical protein